MVFAVHCLFSIKWFNIMFSITTAKLHRSSVFYGTNGRHKSIKHSHFAHWYHYVGEVYLKSSIFVFGNTQKRYLLTII